MLIVINMPRNCLLKCRFSAPNHNGLILQLWGLTQKFAFIQTPHVILMQLVLGPQFEKLFFTASLSAERSRKLSIKGVKRKK